MKITIFGIFITPKCDKGLASLLMYRVMGVSESEVDKEDDTVSVASEGHPGDIDEPEDLVSLNV